MRVGDVKVREVQDRLLGRFGRREDRDGVLFEVRRVR
jgi:hypothetical protein